ncbi:bacillithiol biosynthesis cysteine-adding enzyme BshC [Alloacidobacterium dinghuense]|uniref:Putative cysteine ligase BshC n=1 Tax=Alloacidobacterium dinghuense TaxID=2763107 RepID=A0A7G8BLA7_9BACT|nr:bacillithiol biosynthesis cysteine-adding enzyme BshC [Alloacidobacterium dinghuense]QNI33327.1 bacillithiol biosynthesis cysteine-adding enzyme BshC [Alloacidobacterium dinghuense]
MHTDCFPITVLPHLSRLFTEFAESRTALPYYPLSPYSQEWASRPSSLDPAIRVRVADLLIEQNRSFGAGEKTFANIERLRNGASAVVTGQQVTLFGGPLFTLFKTATVIRKAQDATAAGYPHVPIFWLATEDHDLEEADHVLLPSRRELHTLKLALEKGDQHVSVGELKLGAGVRAVLDQAMELLGSGPFLDLLEECYKPDATFTQAFGRLISRTFAAHGLIVIDASSRDFHALGSPVLRQAMEQVDELHEALIRRDQELSQAGYHSQVLVGAQSSLLFLIDAETRARLPLRRKNHHEWSAGKRAYNTNELLTILEVEPERLSPNALLRAVFQDFILPTSAYIGGPAEVAYFAQSQVVYEKILGRVTPILPRLSATLIEPAIAEVLAGHEVALNELLSTRPEELAHRLGARLMPIEGKKKLALAGNGLDAELTSLTEWMHAVDDGLGRSADVAASKMRYQMNRLRRMAANFQLQKETSLRRHADALYLSLCPDNHPQERAIGAAFFLSRYGDGLIDALVENAAQECPGHKALYL